MKISLFYVAVVGFALGIADASLFHFSNQNIIFIFVISVISLSLGIFKKFFVGKKSAQKIIGIFVVVGCFLIAFSIGIFRFSLSVSNLSSDPLYKNLGSVVTIKGMIDGEPDVREFHTQYIVKPLENRGEKILIFADSYPAYHYGEVINMSGELKLPENFETDNGREFDYVSYLAKDGVGFQMSRPKISVLYTGGGNKIIALLFGIKHEFLSRIERVIPKPESALLGGLILGTKQSLGKDLLLDFRKAGVSHMVVLSGYNVTIVAQSIAKVLAFASRVVSAGAGIFFILLFAIMVGGGATVVRASIMAFLAIISPLLGRQYNMPRALFLAAVLMLIHNPKILLYDMSFQLSFLATFALIVLSPLLPKYFSFVTDRFGMRGIVISTFATQIFVLPFLLYSTGAISVVGIFTNLLVLPFVPLTMLLGFLTGVFGFIHFYISAPVAFLSFILLSYELNIVRFFASLPGALIKITAFPLWAFFVSYIVLGALIFWLYRKNYKAPL